LTGGAPPDARKRIVQLTLDERSVLRRNPDVEHERAVAIFDLIEANHFAPRDHDGGPYDVALGIEDNRLVLSVSADGGTVPVDRIQLPLTGFRSIVRDYFMICESYYEAIKHASPSRIEAIDMGRRAVHNEGAELLRQRLAERVHVDFDTARRLFTLVCVLHLRQ
jgi:uncharacterized protein (UPF0262 family)